MTATAMIRSNGFIPTFSANEISKDFKVVTLSSFMKENGIYYLNVENPERNWSYVQ